MPLALMLKRSVLLVATTWRISSVVNFTLDGQLFNKSVNAYPSGLVEPQSNGLRSVPQNQAQEFADLGQPHNRATFMMRPNAS